MNREESTKIYWFYYTSKLAPRRTISLCSSNELKNFSKKIPNLPFPTSTPSRFKLPQNSQTTANTASDKAEHAVATAPRIFQPSSSPNIRTQSSPDSPNAFPVNRITKLPASPKFTEGKKTCMKVSTAVNLSRNENPPALRETQP